MTAMMICVVEIRAAGYFEYYGNEGVASVGESKFATTPTRLAIFCFFPRGRGVFATSRSAGGQTDGRKLDHRERNVCMLSGLVTWELRRQTTNACGFCRQGMQKIETGKKEDAINGSLPPLGTA